VSKTITLLLSGMISYARAARIKSARARRPWSAVSTSKDRADDDEDDDDDEDGGEGGAEESSRTGSEGGTGDAGPTAPGACAPAGWPLNMATQMLSSRAGAGRREKSVLRKKKMWVRDCAI
jgi:hypothetical protein